MIVGVSVGTMNPMSKNVATEDEADPVEVIALSVDVDRAHVRGHWPGAGELYTKSGPVEVAPEGE